MATDPALDFGLYAFPEVDGTWLRTNFVATLDGAAHDDNGVTASLGGETDTALFAHLRSIADVVLVGAGTTRVERYGARSSTPLVVASRRLDIPERLQCPGITVVTTTDAPADRMAALREAGVDVLTHGEITVDWPEVLDAFADRGWRKVNCEGGPTLHGELVSQELVDDLCLTIAPV